ncbi:hemerythrin domain-containing protein [Microbacterium sp.]|uniref:hemerythrin domain-containing protein n=1 Tax=Microbacterium sp. TaxID=51671 RepID=UPI0026082BC3|nr:hemerythrin domain-containing protein [Microbacterium sp.]
MTERETTRFIAWSVELRQVHARLREALRVTRDAVAAGQPVGSATRELLLYCHGFCAALDGHHRSEDRTLFPAIEAAHPELAPVLRKLEQDHSMMAHLIGGLQAAVDAQSAPATLERHLEGLAAIMESHFRYEERQLLTLLEALELDAEVDVALGEF